MGLDGTQGQDRVGASSWTMNTGSRRASHLYCMTTPRPGKGHALPLHVGSTYKFAVHSSSLLCIPHASFVKCRGVPSG